MVIGWLRQGGVQPQGGKSGKIEEIDMETVVLGGLLGYSYWMSRFSDAHILHKPTSICDGLPGDI